MSRKQVSRWRVVCVCLVTWLVTGCGVTGDKGLAIFHVGNNWQKGVGIALGSRFPVTATRNTLAHEPLTVSTTQFAVSKLPDGRFQAVTEGAVQFQASDAAGIAVDTVEFHVATPAAVTLGAWWSNTVGTPLNLPKHFALVQGGRYVGAIVVRDVAAARLNHAGIAQVTCPGATVSVADDYVEATPTALGPTTATVTVQDAQGAVKATGEYQITVVQPAEIAHLAVSSATVQSGASAPADPDKGPVNPASGETSTATKTQLFLLATDATLADATPVYGATIAWTESGTGHLLAKQSNGGNYAVLKSGETVTVTATVGTLSAQVKLVAP